MEEQNLTREEERAERIAAALRDGIIPERLYEPYIAAALIGITSKRGEKTIGEIPDEVLPASWVGPNKGLRRYYGRNLIAYIHASGHVLADEAA